MTDVVVAGHDRDDATALVVPNVPACRELAGLDGAASDADALAHPKVRETFSALLAAFNKNAGGSSGRFARIILMDDPPSLDTGELTDKGSINQRAVLALRADMVEELYAESPTAAHDRVMRRGRSRDIHISRKPDAALHSRAFASESRRRAGSNNTGRMITFVGFISYIPTERD